MVARRYVGALIRLAQSGEGRDATPQELAQYGVIAEQITELPSVGTYNLNDDAHRLMLISFDGTSGDREGRGDTHTNPDILEQLVQENERVSANVRSWCRDACRYGQFTAFSKWQLVLEQSSVPKWLIESL